MKHRSLDASSSKRLDANSLKLCSAAKCNRVGHSCSNLFLVFTFSCFLAVWSVDFSTQFFDSLSVLFEFGSSRSPVNRSSIIGFWSIASRSVRSTNSSFRSPIGTMRLNLFASSKSTSSIVFSPKLCLNIGKQLLRCSITARSVSHFSRRTPS